jgi:hypothetical protein
MIKANSILLLLLLLLPAFVYPQTEEQRVKLLQISKEASEQAKLDKAEAEQLAEKLNIPIKGTNSEGQTYELQKFENGFPVYNVTDNANSAQTIATTRTYSGQIGGFLLSGAGQILGVWDAGAILHAHQEFVGRSSQRDGASSTHYHATHVAGTMMAAGVNPSAKGMSHGATLHAYDWTNDFSELGSAAANGLKVSNHSYGNFAGFATDYFGDGKFAWFGDVNISTTEDYKFGYYNNSSLSWDNMLYNAPNLLVCKSSGNDRGDGPSAGVQHWVQISGSWTLSTETRQRDGGTDGYDCIGDGRSLAKNVLTIGAVGGIQGGYSGPGSVNMSSFSTWGPTDDGRIKPDLVAVGVNVLSTTSTGTTNYTNLQGTSMSSPAVAGSVGILLEHQAALYGTSNPFRASTMKALIIHTTDEAGLNDGPDYRFGWGLMNTLNAVKVMTLDKETGSSLVIKEQNLTQGSVFEYQVQSNGTEPLKATIAWTDPAGTVSSPSLNNRSIKLVNDLDLRIIGPGGTELPWILDVENPSAAATKGDNIRDNSEQVLIPFPAAGNYTVKISHKGSLSGSAQIFSMVVTGHVLPTPSQLALQLPVNNATNLETKPLFKWGLAEKGFNYQIQVGMDSLFTTVIYDSVVAGVFVQLDKNLPELSNLFWRVRGVNSGGPGVWSEIRKFSTRLAIPEAPELISPEHNAFNVKNNSDLVWSTNSTVETFRVQISQNTLFTSLVYNDSTITDTTAKVNGITVENKKYYWRVNGKNTAGTGVNSLIYNFTSAVNAPDSVEAELLNESSAKLTWADKSSVENRYYILRKSVDRMDFELIDSLPANSVTYTDNNLELSKTYTYGIYCAVSNNPSDTVLAVVSTPLSAENELQTPSVFSVEQNYPNPFNPSTMIKYALPSESNVKVVIFNTLGQVVDELVNSSQPAGYYEVKWNAGNLSSGIYFYSIEASQTDGARDFREVRKMLLLK